MILLFRGRGWSPQHEELYQRAAALGKLRTTGFYIIDIISKINLKGSISIFNIQINVPRLRKWFTENMKEQRPRYV